MRTKIKLIYSGTVQKIFKSWSLQVFLRWNIDSKKNESVWDKLSMTNQIEITFTQVKRAVRCSCMLVTRSDIHRHNIGTEEVSRACLLAANDN